MHKWEEFNKTEELFMRWADVKLIKGNKHPQQICTSVCAPVCFWSHIIIGQYIWDQLCEINAEHKTIVMLLNVIININTIYMQEH